eukprot:g3842.t1
MTLWRWQCIEARCQLQGDSVFCSKQHPLHDNSTLESSPETQYLPQSTSAPASESAPSLDEPQLSSSSETSISSALSPGVQPGADEYHHHYPWSGEGDESSVIQFHDTTTTAAAKVLFSNYVKKTNDSEFVTRRMRSAIYSGNFSAVAQTVIESDDIYGLTMGLTFSPKDKTTALLRTPQRETDGDVVAIKGLLSAGLESEIKGKVVQLMVLAVASPDGYHFSQFRPLVEQLTEIIDDNGLLKEVIEANPQTYSRRMLKCANCTPVYSFVCAHCWPQKVCRAYYWCPGSQYSLSKSTTTIRANAQSHTNTSGKDNHTAGKSHKGNHGASDSNNSSGGSGTSTAKAQASRSLTTIGGGLKGVNAVEMQTKGVNNDDKS